MKKTRSSAIPRRPAPTAKPRSPSFIRRDLEKAETRRLILDEARSMFSREGYANTTMRGIADRIGYTATAIYHHFADKHALMLELCTSDFRALGAAIRAIGGVADPIERIRLMGKSYVRFALEHPEQFRFMFLGYRPTPGPDELRELDPGEGGYAFLKQAVSEAIAAGRFRPGHDDPDLLAQILWGTVHGIATIHVTQPERGSEWLTLRDPLETALAGCDAIMNGLLRSP